MAVIENLIKVEADGSLSFGNYALTEKKKVTDFNVSGDLYYVKSYNEITKVEKNSKLLLETVPGSTIHNLTIDESTVAFEIEGEDDIQITMELEADKEYKIFVNGVTVGFVEANFSGKVNFSVGVKDGAKEVRLAKMN